MADLLVDSLRNVLPDANDEELQQHAAEMRSRAPGVPDEQLVQATGGAQQDAAARQVTNPYIMQKYNLGDYSPEKRQALVNQNNEESSGTPWAAGLGALGAAISGKDAVGAGMNILNMQDAGRKNRLADFDKSQSLAMQNADFSQKQEKLAKERDPNSEESKLAKDLFVSLGGSPDQASKLTAEQFKSFSPALEMKYKIAQNAEDRKLDRTVKLAQIDAARSAANAAKEERSARELAAKDEKLQPLQTPFGLANSLDDAKQLKEAHESKKNFDNKISEMIALREKHGGGATLNREDVARGKQLSKDLLLEYKNMAKLGVLSKSD